jgi:hypothetical protein
MSSDQLRVLITTTSYTGLGLRFAGGCSGHLVKLAALFAYRNKTARHDQIPPHDIAALAKTEFRAALKRAIGEHWVVDFVFDYNENPNILARQGFMSLAHVDKHARLTETVTIDYDILDALLVEFAPKRLPGNP